MATPKLKLHSLLDKRPSPYPTRTLLTFRQCDGDNTVDLPCVYLSDSESIQAKGYNDNTWFYVDAYAAATFLHKHNLVELPEKPNPEREAYRKAEIAWLSTPAFANTSGHTFFAIRKLFISHELLKAGYTLSDTLYDQYC